MGLYNKYVLPKVLNCTCGSKPINYQRKKVVPLAKGLVLDVGIGSGLNIPFYDMSKIDKVIGLDPSIELNGLAIDVAEENNVTLAAHPNDPPLPVMRKTARVLKNPSEYIDLININKSPFVHEANN